MTRCIKSLQDFIRDIKQLAVGNSEELWYRGHADKDKYKLLPLVLRKPAWKKGEDELIHDLIASDPNQFAQDSTTLEQLARAQHYGLPTRLLDATLNPLVALYFAVEECNSHDGEVIVFRVRNEQVKWYDSHTVSCIANLAHLRVKEKDDLLRLAKRAPRKPSKSHIRCFNKTDVVIRLLNFIREEKPYFLPRIKPRHLLQICCVKPKRNSERILVQTGVFLLWGLFEDLDHNEAEGITVQRITIPSSSKKDLGSELEKIGIHKGTMYPEIHNVADYIRERMKTRR